MEYFIIENNGQQAGPFSLEQLVQKAITPETLVWAQGMKDWTPAWKIAELKTVLETIEAIKANTANKENAEGTSADAAGNNGTEAANFQAANQQGFQQAQQEAYQQGFQHGAAMNQGYRQEPEKKKSSKTLWKITSSISSSKMLMPKSDNMLLLSAITPYLFIFKSLSSPLLSLFTLFTAALYHKSTVLSGSLQYLHSCRQIFSLFLPVHMLHPGSGTHKMHVEMCLSSAKTDIL